MLLSFVAVLACLSAWAETQTIVNIVEKSNSHAVLYHVSAKLCLTASSRSVVSIQRT